MHNGMTINVTQTCTHCLADSYAKLFFFIILFFFLSWGRMSVLFISLFVLALVVLFYYMWLSCIFSLYWSWIQ